MKLLSRGFFFFNQKTPKTWSSSKPLRGAAIGLAIGIPAGYVIQNEYGQDKNWTIKSIWSNTSVGDLGRFYDGSLEWKGKAVKQFTIEDVSAWLKREQGWHRGPAGSGVKEWYAVRCPSNSPCEDNLVAARHQIPSSSGEKEKPWLFWGVFDGHLGAATSTTLRESLVPYVVRALSLVPQPSSLEAKDAVENAIIASFKQLDAEILASGITALKTARTHTEALSLLAPGYAGSCCLLSIFDPNTSLLRVACVGDSRAVLGSAAPETGKYVATALSDDQTGFNPKELERVRNEHPGEKKVIKVKTGRVLGLAVTRAFGDGLWKWPKEVLEECHEGFWLRKLLDGYKTPPYVTAEPVVTTTEVAVSGKQPSFMIMASDGLWDHISSEQAVRLVELWMDAKKRGTIGSQVSKKEKMETELAWRWDHGRKVEEEDFVVLDENCATHLVRNALGGGDEEVLCGVVGAQPPVSRHVRDDITVQVVFFGERA